MTDERSKYDTDPLDPDFVRRTAEIGGATRDMRNTPQEQARRHDDANAPTRLFDDRAPLDEINHFAPNAFGRTADGGMNAPHASYTDAVRTPFAQQGEGWAGGNHAGAGANQPPSARVVPGVGLPENLLVVAPYAPLFLGAIAAVIELALVPRGEKQVRFHAAQGLALHGAVLLGALLLRFARTLAAFAFGDIASSLLWLVWLLFFIASVVFFAGAMTRVWRGEPFRVEAAGETTRWLDEQIKPRA